MYEKNKRNKIMPALLVLACSISCLSNAKISVSKKLSEADKAKKAYEEVLTDEKAAERLSLFGSLGRDNEFALIDLNQDGIPEMLYSGDGIDRVDILSYVNGKVKKVGYSSIGYSGYYPNKHLYYNFWAHTGSVVTGYYKFTGKKMKLLADEYGNDTINAVTGEEKTGKEIGTFAPYKYTIDGKMVSYKRYKAYVKKLMKGAKEEKPQYYKNTASNRKKYL